MELVNSFVRKKRLVSNRVDKSMARVELDQIDNMISTVSSFPSWCCKEVQGPCSHRHRLFENGFVDVKKLETFMHFGNSDGVVLTSLLDVSKSGKHYIPLLSLEDAVLEVFGYKKIAMAKWKSMF